jgi:putative tricarboxylic transport membrane protein
MRLHDRWVGIALAVLGVAVIWSAQAFPVVPGQKVGAGFLPTLVGAGLVVCALGLIRRSLRPGRDGDPTPVRQAEHYGSAAVIVGAVVAYIVLAERVGFLFVAPVCLLAVFLALRVKASHAILWAIGGTIVVHFAFYKLLRVPLPWGLLRPLY